MDPITLQRDSELYLDTLFTYQVEGTLFKVPPKYIHENSEVFGAGAQISAESGEGSSDANPVKLSPLPHGCNAVDFKNLLKIIIALTVGLPTPTNYTSDHWLSVLKLSTAWYFTDIRELAMKEVSRPDADYTRDQWITMLDFAHTSDQFADLRDLAITRISFDYREESRVEQVLLGRRYLCKPWMIQGLRELVNAHDLPSLTELQPLGKDTLNMLLYMAFKRARFTGRHPRGGPARSPYSDEEVEEHFYNEIASLFPASCKPEATCQQAFAITQLSIKSYCQHGSSEYFNIANVNVNIHGQFLSSNDRILHLEYPSHRQGGIIRLALKINLSSQSFSFNPSVNTVYWPFLHSKWGISGV